MQGRHVELVSIEPAHLDFPLLSWNDHGGRAVSKYELSFSCHLSNFTSPPSAMCFPLDQARAQDHDRISRRDMGCGMRGGQLHRRVAQGRKLGERAENP